KQKHCHECGKNEIENSKHKCPQYNAKLLTLAKTQQETEQITPEKEDSTKSFTFRSYKFETDISDKHTNSITLFALIGHSDSESIGLRMRPDYVIKSQRFQVQLRKTGFLNLHENNRHFESLGKDNKLSEEMKLFSIKARARHINYIKEKLTLTKPSSFIHPIFVTFDEA
ncbi:3787_t:CDS:2, partial [Funneliformis caledonium]